MKIRSKLIVMLAVPLLALALVALWTFRNVNTEQEVLEDTDGAIAALVELDGLWADLSRERLAVLLGDDVAEAIDVTNAAFARVEQQNAFGTSAVAASALAQLPQGEERTGGSVQNYSDALDIVEGGIQQVQFAGLESDSVLRAIFLIHARGASRTQDEVWISTLGLDQLDQDQVRELLSGARNSVAARAQSAADRVSDGTAPFGFATGVAGGNALADLEASFATQMTFTGETVEALVADSTQNLSDQAVLDTLMTNRLAWDSDADATHRAIEAELDERFNEVEQTRSLSLFLGLLGGFLLFTLVFVIGRSILGPLDRLMSNASVMTNERLPAAVAQLRTIGASDEVPQLAQIPKESNDEIGTIVEAFNDMQASALKVATDQARSRRNVAEMFVSLGRRNQQLNHRMITMISELERDEQDPETLRGLYQLDHLATRMRRNAESLLVLAGNRSPRQWKRPVPFDDVVRSSLAEVEYFERVEIGHLPELDMSGAVVTDITHMLAELLDNATQFSDPTSTVALSAVETHTAVELQIQDNGFGIDPEDLAILNERVTNPPELDEAPSRLLGLFVVGRLAQQHSVHVSLKSVAGEGTTATVTIPKSHFPVEVADNPIQVPSAPVDLNADNAADFFATGAEVELDEVEELDLPVPDAVTELPVPGANPIEAALASDDELNDDEVVEFTEAVDTEAVDTEAVDTEADDVGFDDEVDPIAAPIAEAPVFEAPIAEAPAFEAPIAELPIADAPAVAVPVNEASVFEVAADEASVFEPVVDDVPVAELPIAEASIDAPVVVEPVPLEPVVVDESKEILVPTDPTELTEDSWPLTKLSPAPEREVSPMAAMQRNGEEVETVESASPEIIAAPIAHDPVVEAPVPLTMPTPPVMSEAPESPAMEASIIETPEAPAMETPVVDAPHAPAMETPAPSNTFGGLPTRMPQATIQEVETGPAVLPLDLGEPEPTNDKTTSSISFGHFAKGIAAGLDDVNEGENS